MTRDDDEQDAQEMSEVDLGLPATNDVDIHRAIVNDETQDNDDS